MNDEQRAKMEADIAKRLADLRNDDENRGHEQEQMRAISAQLAPLLDRWEFSHPVCQCHITFSPSPSFLIHVMQQAHVENVDNNNIGCAT
jgi:hypothetical protein